MREAFLEPWQGFGRGVLTGSVPRRAGDAAPVTVCGGSVSTAGVYGDGDQSESAR